MEKILKARLKEPPQCAVSLDLDFEKDWLVASFMVEDAKRRMLAKLKHELHEKIAVLSLDDIEFQIIPLKEPT